AATGGHASRAELVPAEQGSRLERRRENVVVALGLAVPATAEKRYMVRSRPDERAEIEIEQTGFLLELASYRLLVRLPVLDAAAGRCPHDSITEVEADEQD